MMADNRHRLDDVRIKGPLRQKSTWPSFAASSSNTSMNVAHDLAFRFRVDQPASRSRNSFAASANTSGSAAARILPHLVCSFSRRTRVTRCGELIADRPMDDLAATVGPPAAAQRADDSPVPACARIRAVASSPKMPSSSRRGSRRCRMRSCEYLEPALVVDDSGWKRSRTGRARIRHRRDRPFALVPTLKSHWGRRRSRRARPHLDLIRHVGEESRRVARSGWSAGPKGPGFRSILTWA